MVLNLNVINSALADCQFDSVINSSVTKVRNPHIKRTQKESLSTLHRAELQKKKHNADFH